MDAAPSPSRRTVDYPKPETGLAEWTSKIKALQRQVDADEEAEQKRLEEEIAASRSARLRRSRGYGTRADSLDLSGSKEQLNLPTQENDLTSADLSRTTAERNNKQEDALRRLMGDGSSKPTPSLASSIPPRPQASKPEPVSLAAFMGGRATGPRLNRHAPQQDAHDPTQFDQPNITAPHPVFGRGGVAMPGMAPKKATASPSIANESDAVERYRPSFSGKKVNTPPVVQKYSEKLGERPISPQKTETRERTTSIPAVARKYVEKIEERPVSPQKTGNRERTMSTPSYLSSAAARTESLQASEGRATSHVPSRPFSRSPVSEVRATTPASERFPAATSVARSYTPQGSFTPSTTRPITPLQSKQPSPGPITPLQSKQSSPSLTSTPQKAPITTPSLARVIRPDPRPPAHSPQVPASVIASPAFQKPPPAKDLTPSISRLQGRGFVQNAVRASSQLETFSQSPPVSPEKPRTGGRKSSVLDRWQPNASASASPTPSPTYAHSFSVRRSVTVDPSIATASTQNASQKPPPPAKPLKNMASLPSIRTDPATKPAPLSPWKPAMRDNTPPQHDPGLGSATTMMFLKPEKTDTPPREFPVDELGVKRDMYSPSVKGTTQSHEPAHLPPPSGKPLIHPTKDRARKPKKNKDTHGNTLGAQEQPRRSDFVSSSALQNSTRPLSFTHNGRPAVLVTTDNTSSAPSVSESRSPLPVRSSTTETTSSAPNVARLTEKWGSAAPIGVASSPSPKSSPPILQKPSSGMIRRALPGMVPAAGLPNKSAPEANQASVRQDLHTRAPPSPKGPTPAPNSNSSVTGSSADSRQEERIARVASPTSKHTRIPSTGNRATVMDVAQALNDHTHVAEEDKNDILETTASKELQESQPEVSSNARSRSPSILSPAAQAERRKSSYEKYSAIILPSLKEEATPTSTPVGTLSRNMGPAVAESKSISAQSKDVKETSVEPSSKVSRVVHFDHSDPPLPKIDIGALLNARDRAPMVSEEQTLQVEVISIIGTTANSLSQNTDIFYDNEVLAIVHRSKSKSTGLASATVWGWLGKRSHFGEREQRKLKEISKRYGTTPVIVHQCSESPRLVHVLGGQLTVRQGSRAHWTAENTSMYLIRSFGGVIFIDEHDLSIRNLCSAFSYCVTILDSVYVWHGCGSTPLERQAALWYAQSLTRNDTSPVELCEGENDEDEMFWMILGDDSYAKADYWRWRRTSDLEDPTIWKVDASLGDKSIIPIDSFSQEDHVLASVYIIDCVWELFIMVGRDARGNRQAIKLGIDVAMHLSQKAASARPYTPTVHVLVLPSQLPLDLRLNIRGLDEVSLNDNDVPDHMNLLPASEALNHLHRRSWDKAALKDKTMLPVGLHVTDASNL